MPKDPVSFIYTTTTKLTLEVKRTTAAVLSCLVLSGLVWSCLVLSVQAQAPESPILTMKHGFHIVKKSSDPSGTQIKVRKTPLFEPFLY